MTAYPDVEWFCRSKRYALYECRIYPKMLGLINDTYDAIVPTQALRDQPLAALYRRTALPKATQLTAQNKRSMKVLLEQLRVCYVPFDDDSSTFININAQQDWSQTSKRSLMMNNFTHWNEEGRPKMVDISAKESTTRTAIARSTILLSDAVYEAIQQGGIKR